MDEQEFLAERFEEHRTHLESVAYRMLGSLTEADDAVQDAWLRLSRSDTEQIENLGGWLTTVVARVCLNKLRARGVRDEVLFDTHIPDPLVRPSGDLAPEDEAVLADSVGLALLVVLDTLTPAERLAFVLHDMFDLPFEEIAPMVGRTPAAARQLASRARRRVRGAESAEPGHDFARQKQVVDTFFAAARTGDFDALVAFLDPDVVLRIDGSPTRAAASSVLHGATAVANQTRKGLTSWLARPDTRFHDAVVNGAPGVVVTRDGEPTVVMGFTIADGRVVEIDSIADPERVRHFAAAALED